MDDFVIAVCAVAILALLRVLALAIASRPPRHAWGELESSDVAHALRRERRPR